MCRKRELFFNIHILCCDSLLPDQNISGQIITLALQFKWQTYRTTQHNKKLHFAPDHHHNKDPEELKWLLELSADG